MKKVLIVSSSLRAKSNSRVLAEKFAEGAREEGNEVELIAIKDLNLKFCIGCLSCQKTQKCVLSDSMNSLYDKFQNADVLVFATILLRRFGTIKNFARQAQSALHARQ